MNTVLAVENLFVTAGRQVILSNVTFDLHERETVVVAGPSGGGKTTLLRAFLGLVAPTSGEVRVRGGLASAAGRIIVPPERRRIAMVFQDLALWPHLTVRGNLSFGLAAQGVPRMERSHRIESALRSVGLEDKAGRYPGHLSGGERQRVALARALVLDPVALLLDEPLASLDVALKVELLGLLRDLVRKRSLPTLYVTHDPREAHVLADRVVLLEGGQITQTATTSLLVREARTSFGRAFAAELGP